MRCRHPRRCYLLALVGCRFAVLAVFSVVPTVRPGGGQQRWGRPRRSRSTLTPTLIPLDPAPLPVCAWTTPRASRSMRPATHRPFCCPPRLSRHLSCPRRSLLRFPLKAHYVASQRSEDGVVQDLVVTTAPDAAATSATPTVSPSSFALSCSNWVDELQNDKKR